MSTLFLSREEKLRELERWFALLGTRRWQHNGRGAGRGLPDAEMVPWCLRLNAIPGVCTLQSCAGHGGAARRDTGSLWLRLGARVYRELLPHRAQDLLAVRGVERLQTIYCKDGRAVVALTFAGNERRRLQASMTGIARFFEGLGRAAAGGRVAKGVRGRRAR